MKADYFSCEGKINEENNLGFDKNEIRISLEGECYCSNTMFKI